MGCSPCLLFHWMIRWLHRCCKGRERQGANVRKEVALKLIQGQKRGCWGNKFSIPLSFWSRITATKRRIKTCLLSCSEIWLVEAVKLHVGCFEKVPTRRSTTISHSFKLTWSWKSRFSRDRWIIPNPPNFIMWCTVRVGLLWNVDECKLTPLSGDVGHENSN